MSLIELKNSICGCGKMGVLQSIATYEAHILKILSESTAFKLRAGFLYLHDTYHSNEDI
ncbi:hypothetical protein QG37_04685 [Candidozyma auris]|uniref:Uncharacterized protein n=1 Tax=Candidozyma auris TaxID=498019 RepID=A0A0L0NYJ3_CANAR|nr:hypothetical protein QG37_04685 [[Candida] auris]